MSQITHFCGVKFLASKSGSVKFWTNIGSDPDTCHLGNLANEVEQIGIFI